VFYEHPPELLEEMDQLLISFLRKVMGVLSDFVERDISGVQLRVLRIIQANESCRISDLASEMGVSVSAASTLAQRMVKAGLVRRRRDPEDRRGVLLRLSPKGEAAYEECEDRRTAVMAQLAGRLRPSQMEQLVEIVRWLIDSEPGVVACCRQLGSDGERGNRGE